MSLFKVCTWWSVQSADIDTNYDSQLLHCCRFGIEEYEKDYIIVASQSGYLSIYQPNAMKIDFDENEEPQSVYQPTDQLLEMKLADPIMQLSSGKFLIGPANEGTWQLVVLHPMKVSVYSLEATEGLAVHGFQFQLNLCLEHKLTKHAYSVCHGYFGGHKSREFFCVTHMNSTLTFIEQDGIKYETVLAGERNIPSKMIYNDRLDTFLTVSSFCELECYRYQDLGQSIDSQKPKHILPVWMVCIGEMPLDTQIQRVSEEQCIILVLCENLLYGISDTSGVLLMKRLDFSPICFCSFVAGWYYEPDARLIITIVSDSGTLLIYNRSNLIWAAQLCNAPISICRTNLSGLPGAICTLSENGKLDMTFLGSDPQTFQVPSLNLQKLNFEKTQNELIELEKKIKKGVDLADVSMINATTERDLNVELSINLTLDTCVYPTQISSAFTLPENVKMIAASVTLHANIALEQIQIQFNCSAPLIANNPIRSLQQMNANQNERIDTWFYMYNNCDIASATITVIVSFINNQALPRVIEKSKSLPLSMFYHMTLPQKDASIILTIAVNHATAPTFDQLFENDFPTAATHNAIGFKSIYSGKVVTIVVAKNINRYRIQSDDLPAMATFLEIFIKRIEQLNDPKIRLVAAPPLPISALLAHVDAHYNCYVKVQSIREKLKECAVRMRLLERRYFTKLDDKKLGSTESITAFTKATHTEIMNNIQLLEKNKQNLAQTQCELSGALTTITHLIKLLDLPANTSDNLCSALNSTVIDYPEQSWEEMTASGLNFLNYVGSLRKNKAAEQDPTIDVTSFGFDRFKRHLSGLLERICRMCKTPSDQRSINAEDTFRIPESVEEEADSPRSVKEEEENEKESDWSSDLNKTSDVLPRLKRFPGMQNINREDLNDS